MRIEFVQVIKNNPIGKQIPFEELRNSHREQWRTRRQAYNNDNDESKHDENIPVELIIC